MDSFSKVSVAGAEPTGSVAIIIPAHNEEQSIGLVLKDIPRALVSEIIVVDNGSEDLTASVALNGGAVVVKEARKGYGYACLAGIERAMLHKPSVLVFLDGDYSDYPQDLIDLLAMIDKGYDLVIGSRTLGEREPGSLLPQAIFGNWLATRLIQLFWGYRFTDLGPFRAIRSKALQTMRMTDGTFGWTIEMQIKAAKLGLRCTEVPVRYRKRIGKSKVTGTFSGTVRASIGILSTIFRSLFEEA